MQNQPNQRFGPPAETQNTKFWVYCLVDAIAVGLWFALLRIDRSPLFIVLTWIVVAVIVTISNLMFGHLQFKRVSNYARQVGAPFFNFSLDVPVKTYVPKFDARTGGFFVGRYVRTIIGFVLFRGIAERQWGISLPIVFGLVVTTAIALICAPVNRRLLWQPEPINS